VALLCSTLIGLLLSLANTTSAVVVLARAILVGLCALLAFGMMERWPARQPRWVARWVLQLIAIVAVVPLGAALAYWLTTEGHPNFAHDKLRLAGYGALTFAGILFAPWIAVAALVHQRDAFARDQETAFALERSELERQALDAASREGAAKPDRLFTCGCAAAARSGNYARPGIGSGEGLSGGHAHAHA